MHPLANGCALPKPLRRPLPDGAPLRPPQRVFKFWLVVVKSLVLTLAWAALVGAATSAAAAAPSRAGAEAELRSVLSEINDLDSWLSDAERRRLNLVKEARAKDLAVAEMNAAASAGEEALEDHRAMLAQLRHRREQLDLRRAVQAQRVARHMAVAHRFTNLEFIKLLVGQESMEAAERMTVYHRFVTQGRIRAVEEFRRLAVAIESSAAQLEQRQEAEQAQLQTLSAKREQLESQRQARQSLIASLEKEFADQENRRRRLQNDRQRLRKLMDEIRRRELGGGGDFASRKGRLPWPLRGDLIGRFGQLREDSGIKRQGLLLRAAVGNPVVAVHGGRVVFADWLRGFGLLLILDHGGGYMTLYGHADQLTKKLDDAVEAGEVVAHAGQSGGLASGGLYFELRAKGEPQDPLPWLSG